MKLNEILKNTQFTYKEVRKEETEYKKKRWDKQKTKSKMLDLNLTIWNIT